MDRMMEWTLKMPEEIEESLSIFNRFSVPQYKFRNIVFLGTGGGSRTSFDLINSYLFDKMKFPIYIHQGYHIPEFVSSDTLGVVVSYSGNTEETVSSFKEILKRTNNLIVVTSNGKLEEISERNSIPFIKIPSGFEARSSLPYLFFPVLLTLSEYLNIDIRNEIKETVEVLKREREGVNLNKIREISKRIEGKIPFIYGFYGFSDSLSLRMRRQLAENGKTLSHSNIIPDMHHDEIVGFMDKRLIPFIIPILLRDFFEEERIRKRFVITKEIFTEMGIEPIEIYPGERSGKLSRIFSVLFKIDLITIDYGKMKGFDPKDVLIIKLLKEKMRE